MEIKRRDMKLTGFHDGCKSYFSKEINLGNSSGVASIIKFNNIKNPTTVHYNFKDATIVDNNYTWIQLALRNQNFYIKAMYDEKDNLIEIYVDVSRNNIFDDIENPMYEDLFLDVIVPNKGHIYNMDDVELIKAFREGVITKDEFKLSKVVCHNLINFLNKNHQELLDYFKNLKHELEYELKYKNENIRKVA